MGRPLWQVILGMALLIGPGCAGEASSVEEVPVGTQEGLRPPPLQGTLATGESFGGIGSVDGPAVIVFYRSASCGLCRVQLEQIQQNIGGYDQQGANIVGVTLDPPDRSGALAQELGITFPLVSADSATFEEWGALQPAGGGAIPATYIVDASGVIRFRHVGRNTSDRATDPDILTVLQTMTEE